MAGGILDFAFLEGAITMRVSSGQARLGLGLAVAGWFLAGTATADIIGTTGAIDIISPPPSVKSGQLTSNDDIFTFQEQSGLTLPTSVAVDITSAGTYESNASLTPGTIAAGTLVQSYFLHTDTASGSQMYDGSVTFSTPILGVMVLSDTLSNSDSTLGAPGTKYPTHDSERGLELSSDQDHVTLSSDLTTLTVHFFTHGNVDEVRILTAAPVPEPSSLFVAACAVVASAVAFRLGTKRPA
jgi:hypothetical protein